jgi:sorbitol/mannitol transport system substrate-binding protein
VAGSFVTDKSQSKVADNVGFTYAPHEVTDKGSAWLYSWALGIPASAKNSKDAQAFTEWATSKEYAALVAEKDGVANVPPGTRASTYNDAYAKAAPFSTITLESLKAVTPKAPTLKPVPYVGIQLVTIPEFQSIGTAVGQQFAAALTGQSTVDAALAAAQTATERDMKRAGYPKKN